MQRTSSAFLALLLAAAPAAASEEDRTPPDPADGDAPPPAVRPAVPPLVRQVGEVTITTTRAERGTLETPGNVTVIDREAIERSGARDVPDLLRREAGLFVTNDSGNPEGYRVEARGFNNGGGNGSGTLVLVDGRRVLEPRSNVADWSFIRLADVERIEVVRGPASAAWGDGAEAGVIHIFTRRAAGPPRFEMRGGLGSYQTWEGSLLGGGSAGPVTARLSTWGTKDGGYRERSLFRSHGGELRLDLDVADRAVLGVKAGYASDERNRPGTLDALQKEADRRQAEPQPGPAGGVAGENFLASRRWFVDATAEVILAEGVTLESVAWYRERHDDGAVANAVTVFAEEVETTALGVNTRIEVDRPVLGHDNQLVVGGDWLREDFENAAAFTVLQPPGPPSRSGGRAERFLYGLFLQDHLHLTEDLIASAGVRYDRNRREGTDLFPDPTGARPAAFSVRQSAWSPRAALTWRALETLSLYASWARGFRFPNLDEAFGSFGFSPGLDAEKSQTWEVGAKLRTDRARLDLAAYTMNVHDEIFLDTEVPAAFPFGRNENLDRVRHRGVELSGSVRPLDWLELHGAYTYDDVVVTRDTVSGLEGRRMPLVPEHRGSAGFLVFLPCDPALAWSDALSCDLELGADARFVGERFALNDVAGRFDRLSSFSVYDLHAALRPRIGEHVRLAITGAVYNVFDREYSEVAGIRTFFDPTIPPFGGFARQKRFFPSPGRHWEVRVMVEVRR